MVSKNLTPDGQRQKTFKPRKQTLEKKCHELVRDCQSDVALYIRAYGEDHIFVYQSRPGFPGVNPSSKIVLRTPDDHISKAEHLQALAQNEVGQEAFTTTHDPSPTHKESNTVNIDPTHILSPRIHEGSNIVYIDPRLCEQALVAQPDENDTSMDPQRRTLLPSDAIEQPPVLEPAPKSNTRVPPPDSPLFVPKSPTITRRRKRSNSRDEGLPSFRKERRRRTGILKLA